MSAVAEVLNARSPLKLLSINNFHYRRAGSDAAFLDHDALFRTRGWQTAMFSMRHAENLPSPWENFFVEEVELKREYSLGTKVRLAGKVLYSGEARTQLTRLLRVFEPDIVHIHSLYHHISPSILPVLHRLGVPLVMTAHDYKLACPAYKMFDGRQICEDCKGARVMPLIRKRCVHGSIAMSAFVALESALHRHLGWYKRYIDRIVCPSRFLLQKFASWGWPRARLIHIPNFVDSLTWTPRFAPGRYILYFGRLAPEKGLRTLLSACRMADCPVRIVGWGTERDALMDYARRNGVRAEFVDRLQVAELATCIQEARCVVVPSEWYENASLAILEALASGKPVIAARIGGNPELVQDGLNGWLFEPGDASALSLCLQRVWKMDDGALELMGRAAHAFVTDRYGASNYYESMVHLYSTLSAGLPSASMNRQAHSMSDRCRDQA